MSPIYKLLSRTASDLSSYTYCSSPVVLPISCSSVARNQVTKLVSLLEPCIASLIGFVVGPALLPKLTNTIPYFAVCYTSVLVSITREKQSTEVMRVRYSASAHRIIETCAVPARASVLTPAQ